MNMPVDTFLPVSLDLPIGAPGSRRQALYDQLRAAILDGRLAAGIKLPASRTLASHLGISRNSIVAVYDLLLSRGYLVARRGAGTFTAAAGSWGLTLPDPPDPEMAKRLAACWRARAPTQARIPRLSIDLQPGRPDVGLFPHDVWRRLVGNASRRMQDRLGGDVTIHGVPALRQAIAGHVSATRAVACNEKDVLVTHGAAQAFDLLARILVEPGRTEVVVEDPGYPPGRTAFEMAGALLRPVRVDGEGLVVDDIPATAKVICVTPSHQFPLGVQMSARRRTQLLEFAERADAVVIEDDYDGEFRFRDRPLDALQTLDRRQRVFYVGTFSKCMIPDIRLGFVISPSWAMNALACAKQVSDGYCSGISQHALAAFIGEGHLVRHVRHMRSVYSRRRAAVLGSLEEHCAAWLQPFSAMAGLHIAATVTDFVGAGALVAAAAEAGVGLRSISDFAVCAHAQEGIIISYGATGEELIASAIKELGQVCARLGR